MVKGGDFMFSTTFRQAIVLGVIYVLIIALFFMGYFTFSVVNAMNDSLNSEPRVILEQPVVMATPSATVTPTVTPTKTVKHVVTVTATPSK
jgi:hypothetical protein